MNLVHALEQPPDIEFHLTDGVFVKQMYLKQANTFIPQHAHSYSHHSMLAAGAVKVWQDGILMGVYHAPAAILIRANIKHTFMSVKPDTVIYCIHNVTRTGEVEINAEHNLENIKLGD